MTHETARTLLSKISSRPPEREVNDRFWRWLQEQLEHIKVSILGRHQLFHAHMDSEANPALAGAQLLHEEEISEGIFDGNLVDCVRFYAFGTFAANGNTKTIELRVSGNSIISKSGPFAASDVWRVEAEIYLTGPTAQKYIARISIDGETETVTGGTLALDFFNVAQTVGMYATSSASAGGDVVMEGFVLETARIQR